MFGAAEVQGDFPARTKETIPLVKIPVRGSAGSRASRRMRNAIGLPVESGLGRLTFDNFPWAGDNFVANPGSGPGPHIYLPRLFLRQLGAIPWQKESQPITDGAPRWAYPASY
jgi:hypothetical protein